jgi:hypothetical protein
MQGKQHGGQSGTGPWFCRVEIVRACDVLSNTAIQKCTNILFIYFLRDSAPQPLSSGRQQLRLSCHSPYMRRVGKNYQQDGENYPVINWMEEMLSEMEPIKLSFVNFHIVRAKCLCGPGFAYASELNKILAVGNQLGGYH